MTDTIASGVWPEYCCCVLQSPDGSLLLERRPRDATKAGGKLTCFGGRREPGEDPEACIRRELHEELGWCPEWVTPALVLYRGGRPLAWFYRASAPPRGLPLRTEHGYEAVWVRWEDLDAADLSGWHRAALAAFIAGAETAECPA